MSNELQKALVVVAIVTFLSGCGSQKRKEGMAELQRLQSAVQDMNIVVSAGVTESEFSQRLGDALLKFGDVDQSYSQSISKFPKDEQATASEAFAHLAKSMEAYRMSKSFFGEKKLSSDFWTSLLYRDEYDQVRKQFPSLSELEVAERVPKDASEVSYYRRDMLQALWKVAAEESAKAKELIDKLARE